MTDSPPRAILFDIGGVLLFPDGARIADELASALGVRPDPAACRDAVFRLAAAKGKEGFPLILSANERAQAWAAFAGVPGEHAAAAWDLVAALDTASVPLWSARHPDAVSILERCRAAGLRVAAVSNSTGLLRQELEHARLADMIEVVVDSEEADLAKPDPRVFDIALDALGVAPEAAMYVGDTYFFDVIGALAAGIPTPVLYDPLDLYPDADRCVRIRELSALGPLIQRGLA